MPHPIIDSTEHKKKDFGIRKMFRTVLYSLFFHWKIWFILIIVVIVAICLWTCHSNEAGGAWQQLHIEHNKKIDTSPIQLKSLKDIKQWEMLSIQTEELVELNKRNLLGNVSQIAAIYNGTLRIGLNFDYARSHWFETKGDTVVLYLPKLRLLDQNFIHETTTRFFYESGNWTPSEKELLYKKAKYKMIKKSLTPQNFSLARANTKEQLSKLFFSLGYKFIIIHYD